ncbi:MAG: hypothetical protein KZQ83_03305 [gamma proteobacterium symbiont of Taylorina sp.]|nr:hypothetical protein [gamma proteobacterium symbiont of Taylorina sp.]
MPKVLVAGEKAFVIHSFSNDELNALEISRTRNDSVAAVGSALDGDMTPEGLEAIQPDVMMLLKQSETWKKSHRSPDMDGFTLLVFRGKNNNAQKNYIANWCGQSSAEMLSQNPGALIKQLVQGFHQLFKLKNYHKKSIVHSLMNS